ncbi:MAG: hypothetical protein HY735_37035 [Verrucomicrobia bacterium]|nr:hypothetical protein [Verrucomicrobiota bacterium]
MNQTQSAGRRSRNQIRWGETLSSPGILTGKEVRARQSLAPPTNPRGLRRFRQILTDFKPALRRNLSCAPQLFVAVSRADLCPLEIESDPNAVGFYERMGARRVGTTVTRWEGGSRELPVLVYEVERNYA